MSADVESGAAAPLALAPAARTVIAVDTLVEGVHFPSGTGAADVGYKALAVNLSDLAAMGATALAADTGVRLPGTAPPGWLDDAMGGLGDLARRHGMTSRVAACAPGPLTITVQVYGCCPATPLERGGARPGDAIYVSGTPGDAGAGLALVQAGRHGREADEAFLIARLNRPTPRLALGERLRGLASAAIDVSDGLCQDLGHILERSGCGARLERDRLPVSPACERICGTDRAREFAANAGDDYELVFTVGAARVSEVDAAVTGLDCGVTRIGTIEAEPGLRLVDGAGRRVTPAGGYDHFREKS